MEITRAVAEKVLEVVDVGLSNGLGTPKPGQMCVEAAVCYALGLPHGDDPGCIAPALRSLKIALNDSEWLSPQARAKGLRRLALAQLGSAGVLDEQEFAKRVALMTVQHLLPRTLLSVRQLLPESSPHFAALEVAAMSCAGVCDLSAASEAASWAASWAARSASVAARSASWAASEAASWAARAAGEAASWAARSASVAARSASWAASLAARAASVAARSASVAARSASWAASEAARSASVAARSASWAASEAASWAARAAGEAASWAARAAGKDAELAFFAEQVVQILIAMQAPGCQWLDLAPEP